MGWLNRDENGNMPYEDIVCYYHEEFVKTLNRFGFEKYIPSLIDLNVELIRHSRVTVLMSITFFPISFVDWTTTRLEDIILADGNDEKAKTFKKSVYNGPICKALMQRSLESFVHKGWL